MSQVKKIKSLEVSNLNFIKNAVKTLNWNFNENVNTFRTYGLRATKCDHSITIPAEKFEIGITLKKGVYVFTADDMLDKQHTKHLNEEIGYEVAKHVAEVQNWQITREYTKEKNLLVRLIEA